MIKMISIKKSRRSSSLITADIILNIRKAEKKYGKNNDQR